MNRAQDSELLLRDVSDTALWAAVFRARETERDDALFRDPYAKRLAGVRGEQITDDRPLVGPDLDADRHRLAEIFASGQQLDRYSYGDRPVREEIVQTLSRDAVVTRNAYGALVLNAARAMGIEVLAP